VGFEPTIPVFERVKRVHASNRAATVISKAAGIPKKKPIMETTEMRTSRKRLRKVYFDCRSQDARRQCNIQETGELIMGGRVEWNERISRMAQEMILRYVRDICAAGRRNAGRPNNRWSGSHSGNKTLVKGRIRSRILKIIHLLECLQTRIFGRWICSVVDQV
jgi:hypothetical protein